MGAHPSASDSPANGCWNSIAKVSEVKVPCRGKSAKLVRKPISPRLLDLFRIWFVIGAMKRDEMYAIGVPLCLDDKRPRAHTDGFSLL